MRHRSPRRWPQALSYPELRRWLAEMAMSLASMYGLMPPELIVKDSSLSSREQRQWRDLTRQLR